MIPKWQAWCVALLLAPACKESPPPPESYAELPAGLLSQEQASVVLAKMGDEMLTLSDYCAVLLSMNKFERLRYSTAPEREALLDELVNVTLLAQEARRRKLAAPADRAGGKMAAKMAANSALAVALRKSSADEAALKKLVDDLRKQYLTSLNKSALSIIVVDGTGNVRRAGS